MKSKMISLLVVCVFLAGCSPHAQTATSEVESVSVVPSETDEPTLQPEEETQGPSSETSSRRIQTEDGILIELTKPRLEIHPYSGTYYDLEFCYTGLSKGQTSESGKDYTDPPYIKDLQFFRGED